MLQKAFFGYLSCRVLSWVTSPQLELHQEVAGKLQDLLPSADCLACQHCLSSCLKLVWGLLRQLQACQQPPLSVL